MKERVLTAIVLLLIVVGALFLDPTGFAVKILIVVIAAICGLEFEKLVGTKSLSAPLTLLVALIIFFNPKTQSALLLASGSIIAGPLTAVFLYKKWVVAAGTASLVWLFTTIIPLFILSSSKLPSYWPLLLTAAIPIWCGDTAAIFVGKAFGKHKLAPAISPNKTWEGSIGNLLACVGSALVLGAIFHYPMLPMALLGVNCGIFGQVGDLFESWLKRRADVKDSGNILPGHGGLLDRLDSLMATAPFSLLILQSLVVPGKPT